MTAKSRKSRTHLVRAATLGLASSLLLGACGGGSETAVKSLTNEQIANAMLTESEIQTGGSEVLFKESFSELGDRGELTLLPSTCGDDNESVTEGVVASQYVKASLGQGPALEYAVISFSSIEGALSYIEFFNKPAPVCTFHPPESAGADLSSNDQLAESERIRIEIEQGLGEDAERFKLSQVEMKQLGDETKAHELEFKDRLISRTVFVRDGNVVVGLFREASGDPATENLITERFVEKAYKKAQARLKL